MGRLLLLIAVLVPGAASAATVLVVYQAGVAAYEEGVDGIGQVLGPRVRAWAGSPGPGVTTALRQQVRREAPRLLIAVGRWAARTVRDLGLGVPALYAMVLDPARDDLEAPPFVGGLSLVPAGRDQLAALHRVLPGVRRVAVVVPSGGQSWWRGEVGDAAGLVLVPLPIRSDELASACDAALAAGADALWLPARGGLLSPASFDYLRRCSVDHRLPLLVPTPALVGRGALVAAYADYFETGLEVGEMARRWLAGRPAAFRPPQRIALAVNRRVAASFGLRLPPTVLREALVVVDGGER